MRRTLLTTTFMIVLGLALAGPPVDVPLVCGEGEGAPLVGVANLVEHHVHLALVDGALAACTDVVYGVIDGAPVLTLSYTLEEGMVTDVRVAIAADPGSTPSLSYVHVPEIAIDGMLGAVRNREAAFEHADRAHEQAREHARVEDRDPDCDVDCDPDQDQDPIRDRDQDRAQDQDQDQERDQDRAQDQEQDCDQDCDQDQDQDQERDQDRAQDRDRDDCQDACEGAAFGGPPADLPAPGTPRHP